MYLFVGTSCRRVLAAGRNECALSHGILLEADTTQPAFPHSRYSLIVGTKRDGSRPAGFERNLCTR